MLATLYIMNEHGFAVIVLQTKGYNSDHLCKVYPIQLSANMYVYYGFTSSARLHQVTLVSCLLKK